jgi:NAD(P)-dependent dehydrogenase (short-subunit alcohol dehydrogenase family)
MEIQGKTAVVTGGVSGLGEAVVRCLHGAGANVFMMDVNDKRGMALASELGARAAFMGADVTVTEQVQAAVNAAIADCRVALFEDLDNSYPRHGMALFHGRSPGAAGHPCSSMGSLEYA